MAKAITQRVALEGGDDFRRGLLALGQAGQEAFKSMKQGIDSVSQSAVGMAPAINALQNRLKDVGKAAGEMKNKFGEARAEVVELGRHLIELAALAVPLSAGALIEQLIGGGKAASEIEKTATGLGMTAQKFQEYAFAAGQADVSSDDFARALGRVENKASEAYKSQLTLNIEQRKLSDELTHGKISYKQYTEQLDALNNSASEQTNVFRRLGIAITDGNGQLRSTDQIFDRLLEVWPQLTAAQQAMFASQLGFSRDRSMLNVLKLGADGFQKFVAEGRKVAPALTQTELFVGVKLNEAVNKVSSAFTSMYNAARLAFSPLLSALAEQVAESISHIRANVVSYAQYLAGTLRPILIDITKLMAGEDIDPKGFVGQFVEAFKGAAKDVLQALGIIKAAWDGFITVMDYVADLINLIFGTHFTGRALAIVAILGTISGAFGAIGTVIGLVISAIGVFAALFGVEFAAIEAIIVAVGAAIGYYFGRRLKDDIDNIPQFFKDAFKVVTDLWNQLLDGIANLWTGNLDTLKARFSSFVDWIVSGWQKIKEAATGNYGIGASFGGTNSNPGYAGGGAVRGAGTSTSDSILARLSNGEFVVRAKAVSHYGAGFLQMLNNMKIPSPAFALGGLVDALSPRMPRYASGGLVSTAATPSMGNPLHLHIGDSQFGPFMAGEETVTKLQRFAAGQQIRSAGRKPSWQG